MDWDEGGRRPDDEILCGRIHDYTTIPNILRLQRISASAAEGLVVGG